MFGKVRDTISSPVTLVSVPLHFIITYPLKNFTSVSKKKRTGSKNLQVVRTNVLCGGALSPYRPRIVITNFVVNLKKKILKLRG